MQTKKHNKPDQDFSCTLASLVILLGVSVVSIVVLISRQGNLLAFNGFDVWYQGQWHLVFTSVVGLYSLRDFLFLVGSILYLVVKLPRFEKKVTTFYTFYHFCKVNILIQVFLFVYYVYFMSMVRVNQPFTSGIYCYALYLYVHECFGRPGEAGEFLCSTFPLPNWLRAFFMIWIVIVLAPSPHGCLSVLLFWIFRGAVMLVCYVLALVARKLYLEKVADLLLRKYWAQGSQFECFLDRIQKLLRVQKIPGFVTISTIKQQERIQSQAPQRTIELVEEVMQHPSEVEDQDAGSGEGLENSEYGKSEQK